MGFYSVFKGLIEHRLLMHVFYTFLSLYVILSVPKTALILFESELLKFAFMRLKDDNN